MAAASWPCLSSEQDAVSPAPKLRSLVDTLMAALSCAGQKQTAPLT